jgi:hypothetical protein
MRRLRLLVLVELKLLIYARNTARMAALSSSAGRPSSGGKDSSSSKARIMRICWF